MSRGGPWDLRVWKQLDAPTSPWSFEKIICVAAISSKWPTWKPYRALGCFHRTGSSPGHFLLPATLKPHLSGGRTAARDCLLPFGFGRRMSAGTDT